jgi:hypothetical protein
MKDNDALQVCSGLRSPETYSAGQRVRRSFPRGLYKTWGCPIIGLSLLAAQPTTCESSEGLSSSPRQSRTWQSLPGSTLCFTWEGTASSLQYHEGTSPAGVGNGTEFR